LLASIKISTAAHIATACHGAHAGAVQCVR